MAENKIPKEVEVVQKGAKAMASVPKRFAGFNEALFHKLYTGLVKTGKDGKPTTEGADAKGTTAELSNYLMEHIVSALGWKYDKETQEFLKKKANAMGTTMGGLLMGDHGIKPGTLEHLVAQAAQGGTKFLMENGAGAITEAVTEPYSNTEVSQAGAEAMHAIENNQDSLKAAKDIIKEAFGKDAPKNLASMGGKPVAEYFAVAARQLYGKN